MTERATGRHRAPRPARTPLTPLVAGVGDRLNRIDRAGVVVAVSTGLLATGGIPLTAQAATAPARGPDGGQTRSATLTAPAADAVLASGRALTAPAGADVTFDDPSFTVTRTPVTRPAIMRTTRAAERTPASAARHSSTAQSSTSSSQAAVPVSGSRGARVLAIAARYVGVPYVYGGNTPSGFDCSGYTKYVFAQVGVKLPRTADQQLRAGRQISRSQARPGDLIAFVSGGSAYHIGIYAGGNMMYDAGRTGKSISKREIWTATVVFVRV